MLEDQQKKKNDKLRSRHRFKYFAQNSNTIKSSKNQLSINLSLQKQINNKIKNMSEMDQQMMSSVNRSISTSLGEYNIDCPLSRGSDGFVIKIQQRHDKKYFALKVVAKNPNKKRLQQRIRDQISIHKMLKHPNIVKLLATFQDPDNHYMVLEFCQQGDLQKYAQKNANTVLTEMNSDLGHDGSRNKTQEMAYRIGEALKHMHEQGIVHRDVKPNNILVDEHYVPKICDFGYSAVINEENQGKFTDFVGTLNYVSPEIVNKQPYDRKVDVWSYGCVLYFLAVGYTPFAHETRKQSLQKFRIEDIKYPESMHPQLKSLLLQIFTLDPNQRPDIVEVLQHPYFTHNYKANLFTTQAKSSTRSNTYRQMATIKQECEAEQFEATMTKLTSQQQHKAPTKIGTNLLLEFDKEEQPEADKENKAAWMNTHPTSRRQSPSVNHKREYSHSQRTAQRRTPANPSLQKQDKKIAQQPDKVNKSRPEPFTTIGLKEHCTDTVHGKIRIDADGFTKEKDASGLELNISPDGLTIKIRKGKKVKTYSLDQLPLKYHSLYRYCAEALRIIKENLQIAKIQVPQGVFFVLGSGKVMIQTDTKKIDYPNLEAAEVAEKQNKTIVKHIKILKMLVQSD